MIAITITGIICATVLVLATLAFLYEDWDALAKKPLVIAPAPKPELSEVDVAFRAEVRNLITQKHQAFEHQDLDRRKALEERLFEIETALKKVSAELATQKEVFAQQLQAAQEERSKLSQMLSNTARRAWP